MFQKIENVLPYIYENCMTNAFKEKWQWPEREIETGLFKDKYFKKKLKQSTMNPGGLEEESPDKEKGIFEL